MHNGRRVVVGGSISGGRRGKGVAGFIVVCEGGREW